MEADVTMTPDRFRSKCAFCGDSLDIREDGVHQFTSGWVKNRSDGGGHGISLPKRENKWAHAKCVKNEIDGFTNQGKMF